MYNRDDITILVRDPSDVPQQIEDKIREEFERLFGVQKQEQEQQQEIFKQENSQE